MTFSFPVLAYLYGDLNVDPERAFVVMGARFPDDRTMLHKASHRKDVAEVPGWLLDADGWFRELVPIGRRREWARPVSFFVRLVQAEFAMSSPRKITVGELAGRIADIRDRFPEAPIAKDLRGFLASRKQDETVDRRMLAEWGM